MTQTWRNDGLLKTKTWPNTETATLGYDTARRPTAINLTGARSLTRTYDRTGNVTSDTRDLGVAVTGTAGHGTLTYAYDPLGRIIETKLDGVTTNTYTYDRTSNRRSKTDGADSYSYLFDRTDTLKSQAKNGGAATAFVYDASGNLTTERTATTSRTHTYDAANRLTRILPSSGDDADLTYDPLGRIATRQVGANPLQTFRYVGASDLVWQQASTAATTSSIVDPGGARVGSTDGTAAGGAWLLFDLLGSVAGAESGAAGATSAVTNALRYDAFGQTIGTYPSTGSNLAVRYRGLIDLAPTADTDVAGVGSDPLYAMGARLYAPHLGAFTSFDTYAGEAQDPASLNRYLYAHANPTTLIDPTGHRICEFDCQGDATAAELEHSQDMAAETGSASGGTGGNSTSTGTSTGTNPTAGGSEPPVSVPADRYNPSDEEVGLARSWRVYMNWLAKSDRTSHCAGQFASWFEALTTGCAMDPASGSMNSFLVQLIPGLGDLHQLNIINSGYDEVAGVYLTAEEQQQSAFVGWATAGAFPALGAAHTRRVDAPIGAGLRSGDDFVRGIGRISPKQAATMSQEELQGLVSTIAQNYANQGLAAIDEAMTKGMRDHLAIAGNEWRKPAFRGTVIHDRTRAALDRVFGQGAVRYTNNNGPDFTFVASGLQVELTTWRGIHGHERRYPNLPPGAFAGYNLPPS